MNETVFVKPFFSCQCFHNFLSILLPCPAKNMAEVIFVDSEKMPVGFGLALAMDTNALRNFAILPDSQKAQVIAKARNAHGRSEMQSIVHALAENKTV